MNKKTFGAILLIAGTSIGGGMLGLPIATAQAGFLPASFLFVACWALMTFTALLTLEVNLMFPGKSNIISMAKASLGRPGEWLAWSVYLLFLYALVSVYVSGGEDILFSVVQSAHLPIPMWLCGVLFVALFGAIVTAGVKAVDGFNRIFMLLKLSVLLLLFVSLFGHFSAGNTQTFSAPHILPAIGVAITSFGFSVIVPTLRHYLNDDVKQIRFAVVVGSLLPLVCYLLWNFAIFSVIPLGGHFGLSAVSHASQPLTQLVGSITHFAGSANTDLLFKLFTGICVLTAFICVSLGLYDYIADGVNSSDVNATRLRISFLVFLPPLLLVIFSPGIFLLLLSVAGILCVVLQALLPAVMAWRCRYHLALEGQYQVVGGKPLLMLAISTALLAAMIGVSQLIPV